MLVKEKKKKKKKRNWGPLESMEEGEYFLII